jgi:hypothetical protein
MDPKLTDSLDLAVSLKLERVSTSSAMLWLRLNSPTFLLQSELEEAEAGARYPSSSANQEEMDESSRGKC